MINYNGNIQEDQNFSITNNRAFLYGDALFDTLLVKENKLIFLEAHYFRLLASMRQLRMEIPINFTQEYWQKEINKLLEITQLTTARVRTTIFRDSIGLYTPNSNKIGFIIQVDRLNYQTKDEYILGVYKDNYVNTNKLDNLKTTNRLQNVLASIYMKENELDSCLILNHNKQITEAIYANIFVIFGNQIKTPPLSEGCIDGIIRKKIIEIINLIPDIQLIETTITPFELQQASEVFLTNSILGIQPVTQYKKKFFTKNIGNFLAEKLHVKFNKN